MLGGLLSEVCDDQAALGLRLLGPARTAPRYRLWLLDERFGVLGHAAADGASIPGELCEIDEGDWERLLLDEPAGVLVEDVVLDDGRHAAAGFCDPAVLEARGTDITAHGGFAAYWRTARGA